MVKPKINVSARFTVKGRKIDGKTYNLACPFCVFATKKEAKENLDKRRKTYDRMLFRVIELPETQYLINFDNRNKPLKWAVFHAYKDKKDEPKSEGLKGLFG